VLDACKAGDFDMEFDGTISNSATACCQPMLISRGPMAEALTVAPMS